MTYQSIVILTGAGISAESGIPTFRASDGLWEDHKIDDVATPEGFERNPTLVHQFYNQRRKFLLNGIEPNQAHIALGEFSRRFSGNFTLVTQNIDDLHQRADTKNVYPMHGELLKIRCQKTQQNHPCTTDITGKDPCPCCQEVGNLRPHVVWFREMPIYMDTIEAALSACDLFVAIGTSGNVYPAAGFVEMANRYGAHTVEINLEATTSQHGMSSFKEHILGPASETVPQFLRHLLT